MFIEEDWKGDIIKCEPKGWHGYRNGATNPSGMKEVSNFIFEADLEMDTESSFKDCVCVRVVNEPNLKFNMYAGDFAQSIDNAKKELYGFKILDNVLFGFSGRFYFNFGRKYNAITPVKK